MEDTPDRAQLFQVVRTATPGGQELVEVGDLLLELLEEDLADLVVDLVARGIEAGAQHRRARLRGHHDRSRGFDGGLRGHFWHCRHGRFGRGPMVRRRLAIIVKRPIPESLDAGAGAIQQVQALPERIAQGLQVVLHPREGFGQGVELATTRDLPFLQQFRLAVAPECLQVPGRLRQLQDAHGTGDLGEEARHRVQARVVPVGLDEGHEGVADLSEVRGGLARERAHDLARLQRELVLAALRGTLAETRNLIVKRVIDLDQGARNLQQRVFAGRTHAGGDVPHHPPLLQHDAARRVQAHHAQGLADALERIGLRLQACNVGQARAQLQVQRILDPEQVFLERGGHGIQQRAVATRQASAGMLQFCLGRFDQQARQCLLRQRFDPARVAQLVQQGQQHDRDVAMAALQPFQVIGKLHDAAHQRGAAFLARLDSAGSQRTRELLHLVGDHRRRLQFEHAQGTQHLVQVVGASTHGRAIGGILEVGFDLDPRLAQGLVDLGLHPSERGVVDGITQRRRHRDAPLWPRARSGRAWWTGPFMPGLPFRQAGSLKSATERRRSAASCARLPIDSAVWLAPCEVCAVIDWMVFIAWVMSVAA